MSWLFGGKSEEQKQQELKQSLGFDPSQVSDVSSFLQPGVLDTQRLHPLAGLDKGVEYLDLEEEQLNDIEGSKGLIPSRSWTDDLCYGTGAVYLLGLGIGGAYGFQEGVKNLPKNAPPRLQLNTILNHITKRGPFLGNSSGVLALTYNLVDSSLDSIRGKHDDLNSLLAGGLAGALFRSSAGIRPMAYSTALMTGAAAAWCGLKRLLA
ncbi:mitochondrial import i [Hyphopichia burtonii NRRL Y-1933]|uniref:Mitochondrial import inner membrane translocase subunit TIM23 n=1 Tax=Hyphopichia burtonii NRRL Y-1933 TaxID=984485 RepID=A0A1E4RLQ7_9ASCO|nr:mitochondrial import i [Hyphopichia burtonii NRRL Y-1933]ODV68131.1 mitochondrial import i [Hyphopichia burtonii NRRL Y-1933]